MDQLLFKSASVFTLGTRVAQGRREQGREHSWRLKASVWRKTVERARKRPLGLLLSIPRRSRGRGAVFRSLRERTQPLDPASERQPLWDDQP